MFFTIILGQGNVLYNIVESVNYITKFFMQFFLQIKQLHHLIIRRLFLLIKWANLVYELFKLFGLIAIIVANLSKM